MIKVELLSITPNAEKLIEEAGRTCYKSFDKMDETSAERFVRMIIKRGHLSVIEHASATFRIKGGSRSFTHQWVRSRIASHSQQSQRYVNEYDFNYIKPKSIKNNEEANLIYKTMIYASKEAYCKLQKLGIKNEDARFILPNAIESEIVTTANLREWRHIIEIRGSKHAQWEIRAVTIEILKIFKEKVPTVFEDFEIEKDIIVKKEIK